MAWAKTSNNQHPNKTSSISSTISMYHSSNKISKRISINRICNSNKQIILNSCSINTINSKIITTATWQKSKIHLADSRRHMNKILADSFSSHNNSSTQLLTSVKVLMFKIVQIKQIIISIIICNKPKPSK